MIPTSEAIDPHSEWTGFKYYVINDPESDGSFKNN